MNSAGSQLEGSRQQDLVLDLSTSHHWACGMPLFWVLETANHCLNQGRHATPLEISSTSDSAP